jgi:hypothetical protein
MARGPYSETDSVRILRALITYVESDTPDAPFPKARRGTGRHPLDWMLAGDGLPRSQPLTAVWAMDAAGLDALRLELRAFLRFLAGGGRTVWPDITVTLSPVGVASGAVKWAVDGATRDVLLYQTKTCLDRINGFERLRLCPAPDCGRVYLKIGRRENCSTRCQQRLYQRSYNPFAAKPRRQTPQRIGTSAKGSR